VFLLGQIAECLDYLHEKKITHQNLKLSNILVSQKNNNIHLYLSDVALSHIVGMGQVLTRTYKAVAENLGIALEDTYTPASEDSAKQRALHQSFVQNYAFLAPEQKINQAKSVKTDIYAFGILAYYLIMRILPEGFFPLPSKVMTDYKLSWDYFFYHTLQSDPLKRASLCSVLLQELAEKKAYSADADKNLMQWSEPKCLEQVQSAIEKKVGMSAPQPVLAKGEISRPTYEEDPGAIFQADTTVAPYKPEQPEHIDIEPIQTEMVVIHGDEFKLGSDDGSRDERPVHKIRLSSFAIDIHPVINEQFVRFLEAMGGEKDRNNNDIIVLRDSRIRKSAGSYHIESGYSKHPVVGVTWYGAVAYAKWVGKRLPTEAEWEIAAKGGLAALYPTGSNIERSQANFFSTDTTAVMS
ncbi:MAG TPA: SUMF1/EgtB/PvdO family nonheme iron enzyme, partial [Chlamydiales bacterium]|nr:SUMF1/EgtB/PvdO family nonheme iron enzyme [Chlamydiales bacterium]